MSLTAQEQATLDDLNNRYGALIPAPANTEQPRPDFLTRVGKTLSNALTSDLVNTTANTVMNTLELGIPDEYKSARSNLPQPFDLPAPQGLAEHAVDLVGGLVSAAPSYIIPEAGISRLATGLGAGATLSRVLGGAGTGAINAAPEGLGAAAENAALFGAGGALGGLTRGRRLLPSLALGAAAGGLTAVQGGDTDAALLSGGLVAGMTLLPGAHVHPSKVRPSILPSSAETGFTMGNVTHDSTWWNRGQNLDRRIVPTNGQVIDTTIDEYGRHIPYGGELGDRQNLLMDREGRFVMGPSTIDVDARRVSSSDLLALPGPEGLPTPAILPSNVTSHPQVQEWINQRDYWMGVLGRGKVTIPSVLDTIKWNIEKLNRLIANPPPVATSPIGMGETIRHRDLGDYKVERITPRPGKEPVLVLRHTTNGSSITKTATGIAERPDLYSRPNVTSHSVTPPTRTIERLQLEPPGGGRGFDLVLSAAPTNTGLALPGPEAGPNFTLGRDTTQFPNEGLAGRPNPLALPGPSSEKGNVGLAARANTIRGVEEDIRQGHGGLNPNIAPVVAAFNDRGIVTQGSNSNTVAYHGNIPKDLPVGWQIYKGENGANWIVPPEENWKDWKPIIDKITEANVTSHLPEPTPPARPPDLLGEPPAPPAAEDFAKKNRLTFAFHDPDRTIPGTSYFQFKVGDEVHQFEMWANESSADAQKRFNEYKKSLEEPPDDVVQGKLNEIAKADDIQAGLRKLIPAERRVAFRITKSRTFKKMAEVIAASKAEPPATTSTPPTEPLPKASAALSGDAPQSLEFNEDHLTSEQREDAQYFRDKIKEAHSDIAEDPASASMYQATIADFTARLKELAKSLPAEDSPRTPEIVTSQKVAEAAGAPKVDWWKQEESAAGQTERPLTEDEKLLHDILYSKELEYDDNFEPPPEDVAGETIEETPEEAADRAKWEGRSVEEATAGAPNPEGLKELMELLQPKEKRSKAAGKLVEKIRKARGKRNRDEAGYIDRELLNFITRYGTSTLIGGTYGASVDKENRLRGFITYAVAAGLAFRLGPGFYRMLTKKLPTEIKAEAAKVKDVLSHEGARTQDLLNLLAEEDQGATGEGLSRYARSFMKGFTRSDLAREIWGKSNLSNVTSQLTDALKNMAMFYPKLSPTMRDVYTKFANEPAMIDLGTGKAIPNLAVDIQFNVDMVAHPEFAAAATTMHRLKIMQQELIANSLHNTGLKKQIIKTLGTFATDAFRIFNEEKYRPTETQIDTAVSEIEFNHLFPDVDKQILRKIVTSHLDEIYRDRQLYNGSGSGEGRTLDQILKGKMKLSPTLEAKLLAAVPGASSVDEIVSTRVTLPPNLKNALAKAIKDGDYLTPAFRDMLGYYSDPMQRQAATIIKLMPAARFAKQVQLIARGKTKAGLDMVYSMEDVTKERVVQEALLKTATGDDRTVVLAKLEDLRNRTLLPITDNFGILSGKMIPTDIADTLPNMTKGLYSSSNSAISRAVLEFHRGIKLGQTALNVPVSHIRQIVSTPILGILAGTHPGHIWKGAQIVMDKTGKYAKIMERMQELGIAESQDVQSGFNVAARQAMTGYFDHSIIDKIVQTPGIHNIVNAYHVPDMALRIGTFLSHEQRVLSRLAPDIAQGHITSEEAAQMAEQQAIHHTNRYTMNPANLPGGLAYIRKMPFVSLYLTYQSEIFRIMKNVTMDAITGKGHGGRIGAMAKLSLMGVVPALLQHLSESALSPEDRKDWEASQKLTQPYAQPRFKYVLGKRADGSFKYLDFSPLIPTDEWNRLFRATTALDAWQVLANNPLFGLDNTPALNVATSIISGTSTRTGRPINTFGRALDAARQEVAPSIFGGYEFDNLMRALQPNSEGTLGIQRLGSGKGYSIKDLLFTYATGVRPTSVNLDWQRHTAIGEATRQISVERQFLNDTIRSNMTSEAKQAAVERFRKAVESITSHLLDRLEG